MATIIGRQNEMSELRKYTDSDKAEFIAIYGRRRVGKTFLVREMFKDKFVFEVSGTIGGKKNEQMFNFLQALHRYGYDGTETPTTWNAAFNLLQQLLEKKAETQKCILFMDELPCFDTPKAGFVRSFDHFWNGWASHYPNIKLIVCGSATSWMVENIIDNHGGLHNRITHEIHLRPFTLVEAEDYFNQYGFEWNRLSVLQAYMVLGGVPYYYSLLDNHLSLAQNIDRLFFHEDGEMRREHDRLFKSLFTSPDAYLSIIKVLAESKKGLSRDEIAG
jgi:AAA+ ATPase superfamily predicted ATPase